MPNGSGCECEQAQLVESRLGRRGRGGRGPSDHGRGRGRIGDARPPGRGGRSVAMAGPRAEALHMALDSARARAGAEHLAGVDGVLGTLLDSVEIDAGWEAAVEAALGEALQAVVVAAPQAGPTRARLAARVERHGAVIALGAAASPRRPRRRSVSRCGRTCAASDEPASPKLLDAIIGSAVRVLDARPSRSTWRSPIPEPSSSPKTATVSAPPGGASARPVAVPRPRLSKRRRSASHRRSRTRRAARRAEQMATAELQAARQTRGRAQPATRRPRRRVHCERPRRWPARRPNVADTQAESETLEQAVGRSRRAARVASSSRIAELEALRAGLEADEAAEAEAAQRRGERAPRLDARAALLANRRQDLEVRNAGLHERAAVPRAPARGDRATSRGRRRSRAPQAGAASTRGGASLGAVGRARLRSSTCTVR